jgi:tRNA/tmRNA/rRNA uracil-C5-methylase (TrmA/RlmC/RlmD family)
LGCGDGTTALPEATLGTDVLGVDIASNLVEAGNKRAIAAGFGNIVRKPEQEFQQGHNVDSGDIFAGGGRGSSRSRHSARTSFES